jgi:hypothetical protein
MQTASHSAWKLADEIGGDVSQDLFFPLGADKDTLAQR